MIVTSVWDFFQYLFAEISDALNFGCFGYPFYGLIVGFAVLSVFLAIVFKVVKS